MAEATQARPTFTIREEGPTFTIHDGGDPESQGGLLNTLEQIPAGATEALVEVGETLKSVGDYLRDTFPTLKELDPGGRFQVPIPQFDEPQGTTASVVKGASQFLTAFLPFSRVAKAIGITGAVAKGATAGVLADLTAFDPDDPNLSDTINNMAPALRNPVTDFLASSPDDSDAEKRFKRALEGLGLGVLTEGVFRGAKALVAARKAKAARVADGVKPQVDIEPTVAGQADDAVATPPLKAEQEASAAIPRDSVKPNPKHLRLPTEGADKAAAELPKYAGSINLERLDTTEGALKAIQEAADVKPKPSPITLEETANDALALGYTIDDAEKLATSTQAQRAHVKASRDVMVTLAEEYESALQAWRQSKDPADFARLRTAETRHLRGFAAVQKIASEAGGTLQSFRSFGKADFRTATEKGVLKVQSMLLERGQLSEEMTARLASLDKTNPEEIHAFLEYIGTATAKKTDKLFEAFLASILSGPQTHAANILGNLANVGIRPLERLVSASVDAALFPIKPRDRFFGEALVDIMGIAGSFNDATRAFGKTMRTGMASFGTKFEVAEAGAKIAGRTGKIIRTPLRLLSASDEFFKILAKGGDLKAQAYRLGVKQGLKGKALHRYTADLASNPTEEMVKRAQHEAAYRTFTKELGEKGQAISHGIRALGPVRYLAPFIRTPINIAKFGLERTPLKAFDLLRMASKGQLSRNGELSEEIGKLAIGVGLQAWVASEILAGNLTGTGPSNPADRRALLKAGWQPQSVKIGDTWHSYTRLEPFATSIGIMADATELVQAGLEAGAITEIEKDDLVNGLMAIVVQNVSNKTFLQGLTDTSNVLSDPARYFDRWSQQRIRAVVPNLVGQAARAQDPQLRRVEELFDGIRAQLPRIGDFQGRQGLYPIRDYFGEPIEQEGNFWYRYLVPIRTTTMDPTDAEQMIVDVGARVDPPSRRFTYLNDQFELTPAEYDRYQEIVGGQRKILVEGLARGYRTGGMAKVDKATQIDLIKEMFDKGQVTGRTMFIPELLKSRPELKRRRQ